MTVTVNVEVLRKIEQEIERLQDELRRMQNDASGFERLDTDVFLTEVYNG
ncbi:hypothetical protein BSNK01_27680 [Bacillaceae bacterium]